MIPARAVLLAALAWLPAACRSSGPTELGPHTPTPLTEVQAHLVIEQRLLADEHVLSQYQRADLEDVGEREVDFVFGRPTRGVEWLTSEERAASPDTRWPEPDASGPLRVLSGTLDNGAPVQVLLLDERAYLYEGNPRWVQRGSPGIDAVEERLAQDVEAFLDFVASEDVPLSAP